MTDYSVRHFVLGYLTFLGFSVIVLWRLEQIVHLLREILNNKRGQVGE